MFRSRHALRTGLRLCSQLFHTDPTFSSSKPHPFPPLSNFSLPTSFHSTHFYQSSREINDDDNEIATSKDPTGTPKLFVLQPRLRPDTLLQVKLSEALNLANSLEEQRDDLFLHGCCEKREMPPHLVVQNPAAKGFKAHADTYFGKGTVETVKCHLNAIQSEGGLDVVFVNAILSGIQQRNLERAWGKPVLDRVGLIIEIFNAHAQTKEAKLQAELAALMYKRTRLVRIRGPDGRLTFGATGEAEVVSARGRGSGGRGFISGAGETELQLQRRRILERRNHLLSQIEEVRRTRALQRASRRRRGGSQGQGLATVAIVGYTNAGKSTLVGALSDTDLYSDDRLFATVDPLLRSVILPSGKKVLISDTVGFISDLPVQLVEAFHATLEEVVEADLLVHVLDSSAPNLDDQRETVLQVLQQIGVSEEKLHNMIEVWNKIDLLEKRTGGNVFVDEDEDEGDEEGGGLSENSENDMEAELLSEEATDGERERPLEAGEDNIESELSFIDEGQLEPLEEEGERESDLSLPETIDEVQVRPVEEGDITGSKGVSQKTEHVETSAVTGVGLQELLYIIDEKLGDRRLPEKTKTSFDRKWRPARPVDSGTAVEC